MSPIKNYRETRFYRVTLVVGFLLLLIVLGLLLTNNGVRQAAGNLGFDRRNYSLLTGFAILLCYAWQWRLFLIRRDPGRSDRIRQHNLHLWYGLATLVLLPVHAGSFRSGLFSVLGLGLLMIGLTGLLHLKSPGARPGVWRWLHIGLPAILTPLVLLHAWAALWFKGAGPSLP
jgi:hypothetical protein